MIDKMRDAVLLLVLFFAGCQPAFTEEITTPIDLPAFPKAEVVHIDGKALVAYEVKQAGQLVKYRTVSEANQAIANELHTIAIEKDALVKQAEKGEALVREELKKQYESHKKKSFWQTFGLITLTILAVL